MEEGAQKRSLQMYHIPEIYQRSIHMLIYDLYQRCSQRYQYTIE